MSEGKNTKPFHDFFSKRENLFLIFIGLIPIFSPSLFERLFNEYITKPIFENIESNIFVDILVILIGVGIFSHYWKKIKVGYIFNTVKTVAFFILGCWYLYYRFKGGWHYLSFSICQTIFYSDIFLGIIPLAYIFTKLVKEKEPKKDKDDSQIPEPNYDGFLIDEPTKEDSLGRSDYAKAIATKIKKSYPIKYAMAIGITGKWGSGKTSFMGLIEKALIQEEKTIIINFKPRKNHDSNNIIIDFFDELQESLGLYNENLSFNIHQYLKQLTTVDDNIYFKTIDFLNTIIFGKKSTQDMFDEINKAIQQIDRQVIIFIDDIDRLDSKEVIEVIKLIRFSANFNNVVFIVAFDKGYVINAINEFNTYEKEWFLEKIFQVEFPLPTFETNTLKKKLEEKLTFSFPEYETEFKSYFDDKSNQLIIDKCIITMRDVVRFTNAFCLDFDLVKDNVLVRDFINISLLKCKYYAVYELIFTEAKHLFSNLWYGKEIEFSIKNPESANYLMTIDKDAIIAKLKNNKIIPSVKNRQIEENNDILKICLHIFKSDESEYDKGFIVANDKNNLSIRVPSQFLIYSSFRLMEGQISKDTFTKARQSEYEGFLNMVNEWFEKGYEIHLSTLFQHIEIDKCSWNDFRKIIKTLFNVSSKRFAIQNIGFYFVIIIIRKMIKANQFFEINDNIEYQNFIRELFDSQEYKIEFKASLLKVINDDESFNQDSFFIKLPERLELLFKYFEKYTQTQELFNANFWKMYEFCIYKDNNTVKKIEPRVNDLVKSLAIKGNLKQFLAQIFINKYLAQHDNHTLYQNLFPNKSDFYNFYQSIESLESKKEMEEFYHNNRNNDKIGHGLDEVFYWLKTNLTKNI